MLNWIGTPAHNRWLEAELDRNLEFGRRARVPNGFGWISGDGGLRVEMGTQLWITARMVHTYAAATALGRPGSRTLVRHGVDRLVDGPLHDTVHGGWYAAVPNEGPGVQDRTKSAYAHAFVALGAASAVAAEVPGADRLLEMAVDTLERYFWSEREQMYLDDRDETFTHAEDYRGGNANMHAVEAFLILHDVTRRDVWLRRALQIATVMVHEVARRNAYRVNEHFDAHWRPLPDYHRSTPADRFRAFGSTPGHWVEWARLLLQLRAALLAEGRTAPDWLTEDAEGLFAAAIRDAWSVDGEPGFVYTVDWSGRPVIRARIRWVVVEAIGAAYALYQVTGKETYVHRYQEFWDFCRDHFIDRASGSWWQELDEHNAVSNVVWNGKQDIYHLLHCLVVPRLPLAPGLVPALAAGRLDRIQRP